MSSDERVAGSFRDPSGFVYKKDGRLYRQINAVYRDHYDALIQSGLYDDLVRVGLLIPHREVRLDLARSEDAYRVIEPQPIPLISHPYEWTFSQLKDAALTTLDIQRRALCAGLSLKDGSAYNIQFHQGKPILIDTLSFEIYQEGRPWVAYQQFCKHFLAPLALAAYKDIRLQQLLRVHIDGIPLDLAASLLPLRTRLRFGLLTHLHLHARSQRRYADTVARSRLAQRRISRDALINLIGNLSATVHGLHWKPERTPWADYYQGDSYQPVGFAHKRQLVEQFLHRIKPKSVWDLGANTGVFSQIAAQMGAFVVAWDADPGAAELHYRALRAAGVTSILPLVLDLTNPSPAIGWNHEERASLRQRGPVDALLALALLHHLAISNNVPLERIAALFAALGRWLVIEFVPKDDPKVQKLLANRDDIFPDYIRQGFESAFSEHYSVVESARITDSERHLYLMERKTDAK